MKKRIISAIVALLILVPIFIMGGNIYNIAIYILSLLGVKEFLKIKSEKKEIPNFINFISYIIITLLVFYNISNTDLVFSMDYRVITGLFLVFLVPTLFYHDRSLYSINDAFYLIGGMFFLGISFSLMITLRNIGLEYIVYLFLITIMTDSFAYIVGSLIGRHKLLTEVSPNKTWEGTIGGSIFGVFISSIFYITVINPDISIFTIGIITLFLSILGQFGDLCFSAIKRYYGKKDFSNIMPGHGGILDRFDSIIFVILGFMFFINVI